MMLSVLCIYDVIITSCYTYYNIIHLTKSHTVLSIHTQEDSDNMMARSLKTEVTIYKINMQWMKSNLYKCQGEGDINRS